MKKKNKLFIMISGLLLCLSSQAYAAKCYIVWDPHRFAALNTNNGILKTIAKSTTSEASSNASINGTLGSLSFYLKGGPVDAGNGVISYLMAANIKLGNIISSNNEIERMKNSNLDVNNTKERVKDMILKTTGNSTACENMSLASYGSGLSSKSKNIALNTEKETMSYLDTTDKNLQSIEQKIVTKSDFEVCTENDVKTKKANCTKIGKYPAADKKITSLINPVLSENDIKAGKLSNDTFTAEQYKVALKTVTNMFSTVPTSDIGDQNQSNSNIGMQYSVYRDAYITRLSSGVNFVSRLMANRASGDIIVHNSDISVGTSNTASGIGQDAWTKQEAKWKEINPKKEFPKYPSIVEFQKYEIDRRYVDMGADSWQENLNNQTSIESTREQALMMAMKLNQLYRMIESEDDKTLMLSSLLINNLDPTTQSSLENLKSGVLSTISSTN